MEAIGRRSLLLAAGAACGLCVSACSTGGPVGASTPSKSRSDETTPPAPAPLAAVADLKQGPLLTTDPVSGDAAYLLRTQAGVTMLSAVCTHLGCTVTWSAAQERFNCPCHGGSYRMDGTVLAGPPPTPLEELAVRVEHGQIWRTT